MTGICHSIRPCIFSVFWKNVIFVWPVLCYNEYPWNRNILNHIIPSTDCVCYCLCDPDLWPPPSSLHIYLFSWHVIGIFNFLWFVIDIFNCSWSVNRQLTVNCDSIVLFPVNGDCLLENPVNCDLNITRDTWFRLLSVKYLGMAEIYIRRIAQNVPILIIFSQIFRGACPRTPHPLRFRSSTGLIGPPKGCVIAYSRGHFTVHSI